MNSFWSALFTNGAGFIQKKKIGYVWDLYLDNHDGEYPIAKGRTLSFIQAMKKCRKAYEKIPAGHGIWRIEE